MALHRGIVAAGFLVALTVGEAAASSCGDLAGADGRTDIADVVGALRRAVGLVAATPGEIAEADVAPLASLDDTTVPPTATPRSDGVLDIADVVALLRVSVGLQALPGCAPAAVQRPRIGWVEPAAVCPATALLRVIVANPGGLPVGPTLVAGSAVELVSERAIPDGLERVVRPTPSVLVAGLADVSVEGAIGSLWVRVDVCEAAPLLVAIDPTSGVAGRPVTLFGDNLSCTTHVTFHGPGGGQADAALFRVISDQEIQVLAPAALEVGVAHEVVVESICGLSQAPRPSWQPVAATAPAPDVTRVWERVSGLPEASALGWDEVLLDGTGLESVDEIWLGGRRLYRGSEFFADGASGLRIPNLPWSPAGLYLTLPVDVLAVSTHGVDATPPTFTWRGGPAPRCGRVSPERVTRGHHEFAIEGEHLEAIAGVDVGPSWHATPVEWNADGTRLTVWAGVFDLGPLSVRLDAPEPWDVTCPGIVVVE